MLQRLRNHKGSSLVEAMVTTTIATMVLGLSIPNINRNFMNLSVSRQNLLNDLRVTRMLATTRGVHYRLSISSAFYQVERLRKNGPTWDLDTTFPARRVDLPAGITLAASDADGAASALEFSTRGLHVVPGGSDMAASILNLTLSHGTKSAGLSLWPSGQMRLGS